MLRITTIEMYGYVVNIESHQPLKRLSISELGFDKVVENNLIHLSSHEAHNTHKGISLKLDPNQPYDHNIQPIVVSHKTITADNRQIIASENVAHHMGEYPPQLRNPFQPNNLYPVVNGNVIQSPSYHFSRGPNSTNAYNQSQNMAYNEDLNPFSDQNQGNPFPNAVDHQSYQNSPTLRPNKVAPFEPINNSTVHLMSNGSKEFEVIWHQLSYNLPRLSLKSRSRRNILKSLNGFFRSSNVTAILGPSGAGKSTLLEIICGQSTDGTVWQAMNRFLRNRSAQNGSGRCGAAQRGSRDQSRVCAAGQPPDGFAHRQGNLPVRLQTN